MNCYRSVTPLHSFCFALAICVSVGGCSSALNPSATLPARAAESAISSTDAWISSRDVKIPLTLVTPKQATQPTALVLLIHGHGGTRHEAGGFTAVAEGLAKQGISSVRMDFPGCGDSTESFVENNLSNMLKDIAASKAYAQQQLDIDQERLGLLGFSMGGRLAIALNAANPNDKRLDNKAPKYKAPNYKAMALWAPSAIDGSENMAHYVGGTETYQRMKQQAKREGFAPFTTFWGQPQRLGLRWFTDLEQSRPTEDIQHYRGALFVLYGDKDTVVKPEVSQQLMRKATNSKSITHYVVKGADHGLGFFNDDSASANQTINQTIAFLAAQLR